MTQPHLNVAQRAGLLPMGQNKPGGQRCSAEWVPVLRGWAVRKIPSLQVNT